MVANRSESEGSSDGGGRRGQQRHQLRLRCDFVATSGVGCSKGAATIVGRWGSGVHGCCGGGQRWYRVRDYYWSCSLRCWSRSRQLAVKDCCGLRCRQIKRKIATGNFLAQGLLLAMIKEDGSERSLLAALCNEGCVLRLKG
ncbi:hypothetical protein BHM03_00056040 [Ensete ventricosum]|nr:hypothetical protein BHM03_00056040 [Ensete ventricosum]